MSSAPSQGDAYNQRDGSKITIKSILIQGSLYIPNQNDQTTCDFVPIVTIALVLDKQTNGSTLNSEDVYTNLQVNHFRIIVYLEILAIQKDSRY